MSNRFGPRGTLSLLAPNQNSNMQVEYEMMRPAGVNNQVYRFDLSDETRVPDAVADGVALATLCKPDLIVCGNSVEMRYWSRERQSAYQRQLERVAGAIPVLTATESVEVALRAVGASRIAILSPMHQRWADCTGEYYGELGFDVARVGCVGFEHPQDIMNATVEQIRDSFSRLDADGVDTLVHVGGALAVVDMLEALEAEFRKPIVSVNVATYWLALRTLGVSDPVHGFGGLLTMPAPPRSSAAVRIR